MRRTVYRTIQRYSDTNSHSDLPRCGRPRLTTARQDRILIRHSLANRKDTIPILKTSWNQSGVDASDSTIRRRLLEAGLSARVAKKKPLLTDVHRQKRLDFARAHADWTWVDLSSVLWTDESRFTLFESDGRVYVRRRLHEEYKNCCIVPTVKFGGGGVTVWGAMSYRGTGLMKRIEGNLNSQGYIDILENYAVPSAHLLGYGDNYFYMDDNAPCHRSKVVKDWMANNNLRSLIWPPQSPDLNPIENLWRDLGIAKKHIRTPNCTELFQVLSTAWDNIPVQRCQDLIRSMPRRMQAVIAARGGYTKY